MTRRRVLVVGATGTIGSAVVAALRSENDVIGAARSGSDVTVDATSVELHCEDVCASGSI